MAVGAVLMHRWLVAYDVPDDGRRLKLANLLEDYGNRVQYSVFEVFASKEELQKMLERVREAIEGKEDSVRLYPVCESCLKKVIVLGLAREVRPWDNPEIYIF